MTIKAAVDEVQIAGPQLPAGSRGFPVSTSGAVIGTSVVYFQNNYGGYGAVSVSVGGEPSEWKYSGSAWVAQW